MAPVSSLSSSPAISSFFSPLSSNNGLRTPNPWPLSFQFSWPLSPLISELTGDYLVFNFSLAGNRKCPEPRVLCCKSNSDRQELCCHIQEPSGNNNNRRREVMFRMILAAFFSQATVSNAFAENDVPEGFRIYSDEQNKFKILIPREWQVGAGEANGFKSVTAFYPEETSSSNVSVVITELGADYTRLESFGKVDAFAENLVNGLDRSWKRPPGVAAKLIDCKASKGLYYIEYSLQNPGESCRHLYSAIGMASNGWYNRLYTVTGQFVEEDSRKYSSAIEKAVASFGFI